MSQDHTPPARNWRSMFSDRAPVPPPNVPAPSPAAPAPMPPVPTLVVDHSKAPANADDEDPKRYRAFSVSREGRHNLFVEIRYFSAQVPGLEEGYLMAIPQLVQVHFIGDTHIVLQFANTVFSVQGRGLQQLVAQLKRGALHTVQQWSPVRWAEPEPGEPKITAIDVITAERVAELAKQLRVSGKA